MSAPLIRLEYPGDRLRYAGPAVMGIHISEWLNKIFRKIRYQYYH